MSAHRFALIPDLRRDRDGTATAASRRNSVRLVEEEDAVMGQCGGMSPELALLRVAAVTLACLPIAVGDSASAQRTETGRPRRPARAASPRRPRDVPRDGTVLLSPVWHEWRDNGFNVVTGSRDGKAGHLRRDPRASIVVCEDGPPNRGLELRATARLSMLEDQTIVRRIATRYLGPEEGERYAETAGDDLLIRLEPGELRAWDFADYFA